MALLGLLLPAGSAGCGTANHDRLLTAHFSSVTYNRVQLEFTKYASIFDIDSLTQAVSTWPEIVAGFERQRQDRHARKEDAPGFGPYVLRPTPEPCARHKDRILRPVPHRCDDCVASVTLAVFDVDVGTDDEVVACEAALGEEGLARVWYSTFSYRPEQERPSLRLVLPLASPVAPSEWPGARRSIAARFKIPCDLRRCGGLSHFYYAPSCRAGIEPIFDAHDGWPLNPSTLPFAPDVTPRQAPIPQLPDWQPPEEPTGPVDLGPLRKVLADRATSLKRKVNTPAQRKGELLTKLLAGEPLAEHGSRNDVTNQVAGMLAFALPGQPLSVLMGLIRPSLEAMIGAGSRLTESEVERMLLTGMRSKAEFDARDRQIKETVNREHARLLASIPIVDTRYPVCQ